MSGNKDHIYTNMSNVIIDAHSFTGSGIAVFFDVRSKHCVVGANSRTGREGSEPTYVDNGSDNVTELLFISGFE
jgi:acetyltransferase-like isoleucine patch superfamily enzyme